MEAITRQSVECDRRAWAEFLMQPERKKATGRLSRGGEKRCCLGHACFLFLGRPGKSWILADQVLPDDLAARLGMWSVAGSAAPSVWYLGKEGDLGPNALGKYQQKLASINDNTRATPQQIGAYLLTVIDGGDDTPFKSLSDFPEAAS